MLTCNVPWHKVLSKVLSKTIVFYHLGSINWVYMIGLIIEVCSECCTIPSFGVNGVICLRSTVYSKSRQGGDLRVSYLYDGLLWWYDQT